MNKITTLFTLLSVLGISQVLDADETPPTMTEIASVEMRDQHEMMIVRMKEYWNHTRQKLQKVDKNKLLETIAPSMVGLSQPHPGGHHQFILQQSSILAEMQEELIKRQQMLLLHQSREDGGCLFFIETINSHLRIGVETLAAN
ncbi:MAG: hypothetical protein HUJ26_22060 [Planctomycetaceae bacterium]|nr:hypothetical protein [Planctomycetaceae bacterium]